VYEIKDHVSKEYGQKELFVNNNVIIVDDFVRYIKVISPLFDNELEKRNIDYQKFINKTEKYNLDSCFNKNIKLINEGQYRKKYIRYKKKSMGICFLYNIAYYDNIAFVQVKVELSYGRTYVNFYFFKIEKDKWELLYSKTDVD
jgi:uncharacterized membrane protein YgaE (UPF0421/DUF939 family)